MTTPTTATDAYALLTELILQSRQGNRLKALTNFIPQQALELEPFNYTGSGPSDRFVNVYDRGIIPLDHTKPTWIFLAHHDVVNPAYDNVVDNTGSVSVLLALAHRLRNQVLKTNLVFCYTDAEELASPQLGGARKLAERINAGDFGPQVETINLEVSARGTVVWVNQCDGFLKGDPRFVPVSSPFSDSYSLNFWGVRSSCIGIMTEDDLQAVHQRGFTDTWQLCHSPGDKLEVANREDLNRFVDVLEGLVQE